MHLSLRRRLVALAVGLVCGLVPCTVALGATLPQITSDQERPAGDALPLTVKVTLQNQNETRTKALQTIKAYRQEALNEGIITLPSGMTRDQYLTGFGWDAKLERIAIQRAVEASFVMQHVRPDGTSCFSAQQDGTSIRNEILAWESGTGADIVSGMENWKQEKADYLKKLRNEAHGETGHYECLINPDNTAYGFCALSASGVSWGSTQAGESGTWTANDASVGYAGAYDAVLFAKTGDEWTCSLAIGLDQETIAPAGTTTVAASGSLKVNAGYGSSVSGPVDVTRLALSSSDTSVATVNAKGTVTGVAKGSAKITAAVGGLTASSTVTVASEVPMYRCYNPNSGEHFYTARTAERNMLTAAGWKYEGIGWTAPVSSNTPVYRLYSGTDHHYTPSKVEHDALVKVGWKDEGVGWYSDDAKGVPLYRQFNPNVNPKAARNNSGSHNYTTSMAENNALVKVGWRAEGIGWYGVKQ